MKKNAKRIIIAIAIIFVLGIGSVVTFLFTRNGSNNDTPRNDATMTDGLVAENAESAEEDITDNDIVDDMENSTYEVAENDTGTADNAENVISENTTQTGNGNTQNTTTESGKPNTTESNKPSTTESNKPSTTESNKPSTTESNKPSTTESNKPSTTESNKPSTTESNKPNTTQSTTTAHEHKWVVQYTQVYQEAVTHTEQVEDTPAWDEPIRKTHHVCGGCGMDMTAAGFSKENITIHCLDCQGGSNWISIMVTEGSIHHDATYKTITVTDREAGYYSVPTEYTCSCGATKPYN